MSRLFYFLLLSSLFINQQFWILTIIYDEIPPKVEYSLTEKGKSVVPILQSICQWAGIFYKEDGENEMMQCQKCDHHR